LSFGGCFARKRFSSRIICQGATSAAKGIRWRHLRRVRTAGATLLPFQGTGSKAKN
jgi:hypothetical protein